MASADITIHIADLPEVRAHVAELSRHRDALQTELVAMQAKERRLTHPWHMDGWEAFGCDAEPSTVRRLAPEGKGDKWDPTEVHEGITRVEISCYGDHPTGAFIQVNGTEREAVVAAYRRARTVFDAANAEIWGAVGSARGAGR